MHGTVMEVLRSETVFALVNLVEEYFESDIDAMDALCNHQIGYSKDVSDEEAKCFVELLRYREYLKKLLDLFCTAKKVIKEDDKHVYLVIIYIICFKLPKMSESSIRDIAYNTYPLKWKASLEFFYQKKHLISVAIEGSKILDIGFCRVNILVPLQNKSQWMKRLSQELKVEFYKLEKKQVTIPKWPFSQKNVKEPREKADVDKEEIKRNEKPSNKKNQTKPLSKDHNPQIRLTPGVKNAKNQRCKATFPTESTDDKEEGKKNFTVKCEKPQMKNNESVLTSNKIPKYYRKGPKLKDKKVHVVLNTATLLRQGATIQQNEWRQMKRLQELCVGGNDPFKVDVLEAEKRELEKIEERVAVEANRLRAQLWQEEAVLAREGVKQRNYEKALQVKAEKEEISEKKNQLKAKEEILVRELVEKTQMMKANVQYAVERSKKRNMKKAKKVSQEIQALKEAATKEREIDLSQRAEIVSEIHKLHKSMSRQTKKLVDPTETAGLGLSCEMSLAELKERLNLAKRHLKEEIEDRREWVKNKQQEKKKLLWETEKYIAAHEQSREKMFPNGLLPTQKQVYDEPPEITELKKQLERKRLERKRLMAEKKWMSTPLDGRQEGNTATEQ